MAEKMDQARSRHKLCWYIGALLVIGAAWAGWNATTGHVPENVEPVPVAVPPRVDVDWLRPQVEQFCGNCHASPSPADFPKQAWNHEVDEGYRFYRETRRTDLKEPRQFDVEAYFRQLAPDKLVIESIDSQSVESPLRFQQRVVPNASNNQLGIAHVSWLELNPGRPRQIVLCDMIEGGVYTLDPRMDAALPVTLAKMSHPAHATPCDLDHDGQLDLLLAELGSRLPEDHDRGRVSWLHRRNSSDRDDVTNEWEAIVLHDKLGRVADVQSADFDGDGDDDLVVAEFGWRATGRILMLENEGMTDGLPKFRLRVLDDRHGTIHVPIVDLNRDGRPDFVALISQEHETVVAFLNEGNGEFRRETIMIPRDPAYGSSGIQLVDLDQDGDLDVLYTNGDSFDRKALRPYHGIQWLENRGEFPFVLHPLTTMPGVHRALAGDLDGDGDLDLVAVAFLPQTASAVDSSGQPLASVIWMEQTQPGKFIRHPLEFSVCLHATCELADVDDDGDLDLVVGHFSEGETGRDRWLTTWVNEGR